jgi:hypothetical protein
MCPRRWATPSVEVSATAAAPPSSWAPSAGGYRSFNFHHWWQTSLQLYAQVRMDITEPRNLQFMMGVEIDFAQAVIVPALMIRMKVRGGDPEELDQDEDGIPDAEEEDDEESSDAGED